MIRISTDYLYSQDDSFRYLSHHGIKGQKWGIRRYQNEDGSLTSAGKKRYYGESLNTKRLKRSINSIKNDIRSFERVQNSNSMSDAKSGLEYVQKKAEIKLKKSQEKDIDKSVKRLKKDVQERRGQIYGEGNKWIHGRDIGENSRKALEKYRSDLASYNGSKEVKDAITKLDQLDHLYEIGKIDDNSYESSYKKIQQSIYNPKFDSSVRYMGKGVEYSEEFINGYGKNITVGFLEDLGYNKETSEKLVKRILKSNIKIIW